MPIAADSTPSHVVSVESLAAVILAGGLGTRLREVVSDRPKALAEVQGRPFLAHLLERLDESGIRNVVVCTGHMGDQVKATFGGSYSGLSLTYSQESSPLGTAGALRLALPIISSVSSRTRCPGHDSVLVMNGDSLCAVDLPALIAKHQTAGFPGTLVLAKESDTSRYGRVQVDTNGKVLSFEEKDSTSGPGWINAGTYLLNRVLIESIPPHGSYSLERQMFPAWMQQGLFGYKCAGRFLDIGTPESYKCAEAFLTEDLWPHPAAEAAD